MALAQRLFSNNFFLAAIFVIIFLCTNAYIFAWDDQHLEIPTLKRLIDPSLYPGDYYVDGLVKNFTSYLYPILAKCISIDMIPSVYFVLFLVSRFFMFFWIFKLWELIGKNRWYAVAAVVMFIIFGRTEEFLYRTFSHQEFSYIFMFAGLYYFYKEKFLRAAIWLGLGANIHAIYCLFPMLFMGGYILLFHKDRISILIKVGFAFAFCAMPFLWAQIPHSLSRESAQHVLLSEWMPLYLKSCPQNFLFSNLPLNEALQNTAYVLTRLEPYLFLLLAYALLCLLEPKVRRDRKLLATVLVGYALIIISVVFSYIHPSRFVIDLNLLRNEQFVRFFIMGYVSLWAARVLNEGRAWYAIFAFLIFMFIGFGGVTLLPLQWIKFKYIFYAAGVLYFIYLIRPQWRILRILFIAGPLFFVFVSYCNYHVHYLKLRKQGSGLWQMHRNWVDMQKFVKAHTAKDALIMTPFDTDTGGFRIFSERRVLVCYRDCGIIGFDYPAAVEWNKRIQDIEGFRMFTKAMPYQAIINGITKYKVDYIVFMNYYQPNGEIPGLIKMYQNEVFVLYKVMKNV